MQYCLANRKRMPPVKSRKGNGTPVMRPESMAQGQNPNQKSQYDHSGFKPEIVDDIYPENGQPGQKER